MRVLVGWPEVAVDPKAVAGSTTAGTQVAFERDVGWASSAAAAGGVHVLVAGRLYNRTALANTVAPHAHGEVLDDAGVVLRLWAERGPSFLPALRGAFALALWDGRLRRLLLARDQLGLIPLYVTGERSQLAASPSLPALLGLPGVSHAWDAAALDALLTIGVVPPPATPYLAVRQIGPGESMVLDDGRPRTQRWWQLMVPDRTVPRGDGTAAVEERLHEAVRMRATGVRATFLLSGGLAAAGLLSLAVAEHRAPPRAITWVEGRDGPAEARLAARTAERAGIEHVIADGEPDWADAVDAILERHGMPVPGFDLPYLATAVTPRGWLVGGHGADAVLGGAEPHRAWLALERFRALPGPLREVAQLWARFERHGRVRALVDGASLAALGCVQRAVRQLEPSTRAELYTPETLAALGGHGAEDLLGTLAAEAVAAGADHPLDVIHHVTLQLELPALAALHREAAARGGELRLPLVDHRLAQVVAGVAPERRGTASARLLLLRAALGRTLPRAVARQPHRAVAPEPAAWTREPLRGLLEDGLSAGRLSGQGVFQPDAVRRLVAEHRAGRADHGARLWSLILVTRWLDRVGGPSVARGPSREQTAIAAS